MYLRSYYLPLFCLALTVSACGPKDQPAETTAPSAPDISEALLGTWETIEIEVSAPTYQGQDTLVQQIIREADWGRAFGVRPAKTIFTPDGKLKRTHTLQGGQVSDITNGLWKAQGTDSLLIIEPNKTLYYKYELSNNRLTLTGIVDWDFDGEVDDSYRSVLRLVSRTE